MIQINDIIITIITIILVVIIIIIIIVIIILPLEVRHGVQPREALDEASLLHLVLRQSHQLLNQ